MRLSINTTEIPQLNGSSNKTMSSSDSVRAAAERLPPPALPARSLWVCLPVTSSSQKNPQKPQQHSRSHDAASVQALHNNKPFILWENISPCADGGAGAPACSFNQSIKLSVWVCVCVCVDLHPVYTARLLLPAVRTWTDHTFSPNLIVLAEVLSIHIFVTNSFSRGKKSHVGKLSVTRLSS